MLHGDTKFCERDFILPRRTKEIDFMPKSSMKKRHTAGITVHCCGILRC